MKTKSLLTKLILAFFAAFIFLYESNAQTPVSAFSANATTGCYPFIVSFSDASLNTPTSWLWDFGNGNTSVFQNPSASYSTAGLYTVKLIVCNSDGCDTLIKDNYITAVEKPDAGFISSDSAGCAPFYIQFTDSSIPVSSPIVSWYWDFGDGNFSTLQNPAYVYAFPGIYNISLSITDSLGCNKSKAIDSFIVVSTPPVISFGIDTSYSCAIPFNVIFFNNTIPGSYPVSSWLWDFGDSFSDTAFNTQHLYENYGKYSVTLSASDSIGCSSSAIDSNAISIGGDSTDFTFSTLRTCDFLQVNFSGWASDSISSWDWDFGEGSSAAGKNVTHNYTNTGIFEVALFATNSYGCTDTVIKSIYFRKAESAFSADTTYTCFTPFTVSFTNSSSGTAPLSYQWNFSYDPQLGFSSQSTLTDPSYTYFSQGVYDVMLVVTDSFGCTDTASLGGMNDSINIFTPQAAFSTSPKEGCGPLNVFFTSGNAGISPIVAWQWNFGDPASGSSNFSSMQNPVHTFNDTFKIFSVQLTIKNSLGCIDSATGTVQTGYFTSEGSLIKSSDSACHRENISYFFSSPDTNINSGNWIWGDGTWYSGETSVVHSFQTIGEIVVQFQPVVNGCAGGSLYDTIVILPPYAAFTASPSFSCELPMTVAFTNNSLDIDNVSWNFGDGSPLSDTTDPVHTYTLPGSYSVLLTVSNDSTGCIDSISHRINSPEPLAAFTANKVSGCTPLTVNFTNLSSTNLPFQYPVASYYWDFGDNTTSNQKNPTHTYTDTSSFTVMLVITDAGGCTDTLIKPGFITTSILTAGFSQDYSAGCSPLQVSFTDQSIEYFPIISWLWDFGDSSSTDSTQNPVHIYSATGNYTPSLTVTDSIGCSKTFSADSGLIITKPDAQFAAPGKVCLFDSAYFSNNTPGLVASYLWDFGDGDSSVEASPSHYYSDTGLFTVTLIATDTNNCTDTATVQLDGIAPPIANLTLDTFLAQCPPLLIHFNDLSTDINDSITTWVWNFGDNGIATVPNPIHTYSYADSFSVSLKVTNSTGCSDSLMIQDMIIVSGPYGDFNFSVDSGCVPTSVYFSAIAENTEQFIWDFGDGIMDTTLIPSTSHSYIQAGFHIPQLSLVDSVGCKVAVLPSGNSALFVDEVVAGFSFSPAVIYTPFCPPDTVFFSNSSLALNDSTSITQWLWNFGDGIIDSVESPSHVYSDTGEFDITLISYSSAGCSDTLTKSIIVTLNDSLVLKAAADVSKNVSCFGLNDGEAVATGLSGTEPYTYLWSNGDSTFSINNLLPEMYNVTVMDANGCIAFDSILISQPAALIALVSSNEVSCHGGNDGSSSILPSGGTPPYSYLWTNLSDTIATTSSVSGLTAQIYYITVTDSLGCTFSLSDTIKEPDSLLLFILNTLPALCFGDSSGSAEVSSSGGTSPYSYNWLPSFAGNGDTAINLPAQNYTVMVADNKGCDTSLNLTITQPTQLITSITTDDVSCFNGNDGSVTANPSGGTPIYTYLWSLGDSSVMLSNLEKGIYHLTLTDANGCNTYDSAQVLQPDSIEIVFDIDSVSCFGGNDGTAEAFTSGGTNPFSYLWNTGDTNSYTANLTSAILKITVTDSAGCVNYDSAYVNEPDSIALAFITDSVSCFEGSDGSASVFANGGTPPYTFLWNDSDSQITATATGLVSGTWAVTVNDANNCFGYDTVIIGEPVALTLDFSTTAALCFGDSTGSAAVSSSGGTSPYSYSWMPSFAGTSDSANNLPAQDYTVVITDDNGCDTSLNLTINQPSQITTTITTDDVSCYSGNDGSVIANVNGGTPFYTFLWSLGDSSAALSNLAKGIYYITVEDSNGCFSYDSAKVLQPDSLIIIFNTDSASCFAANDGSVTATASGGTLPYGFLWSTGDTNSSIINLSSSIFNLTLTDSAGCVTYDSVLMPEPDSLTLSFNTDSVSCFEGNNGAATVNATGGTLPYTFLWNDIDSQITATATGLNAAIWRVTVTDAHNCFTVDTVIIAEPLPLELEISTTAALCNADSTGTAVITVTGGISPYSYLWNTAETDSSISNLTSATYSVTVTDKNNCSADTGATVQEPSKLLVSTSKQNAICYNENTGTAWVITGGGIPPYTYLWSNSQNDSTASGLSAGFYFVTVKDSNACTVTDTAIVGQPPQIIFAFTTGNNTCYGDSNGSAMLGASGGTPPYSYLWNDFSSQTTATATGLFSSFWTVTVTDSAGCKASDSVHVPQPDLITVSFISESPTCFGGNEGSATLTSGGGTPPYTYIWNDSTSQTGQTLTGVAAGTYTVSITDTNNCLGTGTAVISNPIALTPTISKTNVLCFGDSNGTAIVSVSGGTSPFIYQWNDPDSQTTWTATGLPPGTWMITVRDTNNCLGEAEVIIVEPGLLKSTILGVRTLLCTGEINGELAAQPSGGVPPYNYFWEPVNSTASSISGLSPGQYILKINDNNGCTGSDTIDIGELLPLTIAISANDSDTACYNIEHLINAQPTGSAPPYSFLWTNGIAYLTSNPASLWLTASETWTVTVTDSVGCKTSGSQFLFVNKMDVSINSPDTACLNGATNFEAVASGGLPGSLYHYLWNTGDTASEITVSLENIAYYVTASDGCSKQANDSATVYTYPIPSGNIEIYPYPVCPNTEVVFMETENNLLFNHVWNFGDGNISTGKKVKHSYSAGGDYYPSVTLTTLQGCNFTFNASEAVKIYAAPDADFTANPFEANIRSPLIEFIDLSSIVAVLQDEIISYYWDFGDGGSSDLQNVSHSFTDTGSYPVTLTVSTQYGCETMISKEIIIRPYIYLQIPTAFTPNAFGSPGGIYDRNSLENDVFYPITEYVSDYKLRIFNRWGELIFESTTISIGWDGYYKGKPAQLDTYIWKMEIVWVTGEQFIKEGRVLLIR